MTICLIPVSEPFPACVLGRVIEVGSVSGREEAPVRRVHDQDRLSDAAVPKDLDLHLVLDNYATRKTPEIHKWLLRHPCFHLHFTRPARRG